MQQCDLLVFAQCQTHKQDTLYDGTYIVVRFRVWNTSSLVILTVAYLRELPILGRNADLSGVPATSFEEGVHHVALALPGNSWACRAWVLELKLGRGGGGGISL
jgi:hypothetical protein